MEAQGLTYFYPQKGWKGEYGFDQFRSCDCLGEVVNAKGDKASLNFDNICARQPLHPCSVKLTGEYTEEGLAAYSQKLEYDQDEYQTLTRSDTEKARFYLQHSQSQQKWYVIHQDDAYYFYFPVPSVEGASQILVRYFDGHQVTYQYQAGMCCGLVYKDPQDQETEFTGSAEAIVNQVHASGLKVIEELLTNAFYCQVEQIHPLDEGISRIEINMQNARSVKCVLQVEKTESEIYFGDPERNEIVSRPFDMLKVIGGKANLPTGMENGTLVYTEVSFDAEQQQFEEHLVPIWCDFLSQSLITRDFQGKKVFCPVPSVLLVNYDYNDKKNGLANHKVELELRTIGPCPQLLLELEAVEQNSTVQLGSIQQTSDILRLFSTGMHSGLYLLKTYDGNKTETGRLNIFVMEPIHLKICFVKVGYQTLSLHHAGSSLWSYQDDQYLEILGQAGIVFDDIVESSMDLEDVPRKWDPELMDDVLDDAGIDLNAMLDERFLGAHPEFAGHYRVYILDQYKVERDPAGKKRFITYKLPSEKPIAMPLVMYKKSIEAGDAKESNPLAHAILRNMGLSLLLDFDKYQAVKTEMEKGTTTNVADCSEYRYTLSKDQWIILRMVAEQLGKRLEEAAKQANKEVNKNHGENR